MKFEEFEHILKENGYGIVAMNHFDIAGCRWLYCVILNKDKKKAFKAEYSSSETVFSVLGEKIELAKL